MGDEIDGQVAPEFKFEDLDVPERRVDVDEPVGADEPVGDSPSHLATADVPTPIGKCRDGQDLPGMELDVVDGNPTDVSSLVLAAPFERFAGVSGGQVEPIVDASVRWMLRPEVVGNGCNGNQSEKGDFVFEGYQSQSNDDISMRHLMKLMNQAEADEARKLNQEILSLVRNLGGDSAKYRRERSRAVRAVVSEIYSLPCVSAVAKLCPSYGILPGFALDRTTNDSDGRH